MKINNIFVEDKLIKDYINHFGSEYKELADWESERERLHNSIFESVSLDRHSSEGKEFSDALDKHCIPMIEKKDYFVAGLKKIGIAKNEFEIQQANLDLRNRKMFEELQKRKKGLPSIYSEETCRVCDKDLSKNGARVNDHLMASGLDAEPVDRAICMDCADNRPDEHFSEFRRKYWSH